MSPPQRETPPAGERGALKSDTTSMIGDKDTSVEYAVRVLGEVLNDAFTGARRLDQLARMIATAFAGIGFDDRVELGEKHPRLTEGLILLEDALDRMDRR